MNAIATSQGPQWRKPAIRVAGSLALLALMALVFPRHKLIEALRGIPLTTLAAIVPIYLAIHFQGCLKWYLVVNRAGAGLSLLESMRCYYGGMFANIFLPSIIGGDVVVIALGAARSASVSAVVSGTLASRVLDLVALLLLSCWAVWFLPRGTNPEGERLLNLIFAVFGCAGVLACIATFLLRRRIVRRAAEYWDAFVLVWRGPQFALAVLALCTSLQIGLILLTAWLGVGCGLDLPLRAWLFAWPLAKLAAFVPLTLAGIGTREFVLAALLARFGAEPAASAGVGLAWDAVFIVGGLAAGAISKFAGQLLPVRSSPAPAPGEPCVT